MKTRAVAVALSGGVDSICLTDKLLKSLPPGTPVKAITVNHNYRAASHRESRELSKVLKNQFKSRALTHEIIDLHWDDLDPHSVGNFEKIARQKRYAAILDRCHKLGIDTLYLGHNHDDQIETFVQRLLKNSTIFGLKCMQEESFSDVKYGHCVTFKRPLLETTKTQIYDYARQRNLRWFEDSTNTDITLTSRNLIRSKKLPKSVSRLYERVKAFNALITAKSLNLHRNLTQQGRLEFDPNFGKIELELPVSALLDRNNDFFLNRFLWCLNYPISSLRNYHYTYSDSLSIYKKLYSALSRSRVKANLLGSSFSFQKAGDQIKVTIQREIQRIETPLDLQPGMKNLLYDNRFWITYNGKRQDLKLKLFTKKDIPKLTRFWETYGVDTPKDVRQSLKSSQLLMLPVVINSQVPNLDHEIIAFPTLAHLIKGPKLDLDVQLCKKPLALF